MPTVYFSPIGNGQTFFNTQGQILSGGKIFTYVAGSTTPIATYTDNTGSVQNANPIILNSAGQSATEVWLTASTKFIIQDSLGNTIQTLDNIAPINLIATTAFNEWTASGLTPTYIAATQFSVVGDQTLVFTANRRVKATVTAGTVYGSVSTAVFAVGVTTVTLIMDSGALDSGLSSVSYGFTDPTHPSYQVNNNAFTGVPTAPTAANGTNTTQLSTTAFVQQSTLSNKLPTIGCTQASGALTFSASPEAIDFRSSTLASGAITTIYASPANLVLPSGGTLGFTSAVSGDIVIAEINNSGTVELAIQAISGGTDMTESGLINTTSISAASTANNVWYSTTARTNVPYRIIGKITAVNTAGAWGTPTLIQGAGGVALPSVPQMRLSTTQATTSGTSIDFTGIPSWTKRITVNLNGVSTNSTAGLLIQVGAGAVETSGYNGMTSFIGVGNITSTAGIPVYTNVATNTITGSIVFTYMGSNLWIASGTITDYPNTANNGITTGNKTASGIIDRLRLTTTSGTPTFDAGSINILYEG